ncbi:MAG: SusC/RagA family TonB-linked outer membrane protein [Odoribacter sp.]
MKKNRMYAFRSGGCVLKFLKIMRLGIYLLLLTTFTVNANSFSQKAKVTLNMEQRSMLDIVKELREVSDYQFLYQVEELKKCGKRDLKVEDAGVEEVMRKLLEGTHLTWRLEDGVILIKTDVSAPREGKVIQGKVKDSKGELLPGVTVLLKGTSIGGVTDVTGSFKFEVPVQNEMVLVFSFVGMKKKEIVYRGEKELQVVMENDVAQMEEVVVTGVFTKAKESYTGAVTTITAKDLQRVGNRNLLSSIRNIDPSFNIVEDINIGSDPNKLPDITVRGSSSLSVDVKDLQTDSKNKQSPNQPLFIMDGFEISLERMMDLDDNQVASITLLKDASATAMYGTRGANGVVVITSKKPEEGRIRITYKGSLNIEAPDLTSYDLLSAKEKLKYEYAAGLYNSINANMEQEDLDLYNKRMIDAERGINTYWLKYPVRTGVGHRHSLRLEGGDESFRYAAGLSYNNVTGAMKGSDRNTFNGNVFLSYKYKNLTFQNDLQISSNKSKNSPYGTFSDYAKMNSYWTPYDDEGNLIKVLENHSYVSLRRINMVYNPLYNAQLPSRDESEYNTITNNFALEWNILPELFFRGRLGITSKHSRSDVYKSAKDTDFDGYEDDDYARKGTYAYGTGEGFNYEADFTLNYSKNFVEKHQVYVGLGFNFAQDKFEDYKIKAEGISNVNMDFLGMASKYEKDGRPYGSEGLSRRLGGILNANYTYDRRYFFDVSGKIDGSSQFGADNRYAPFWSAGMGWNLHHENFWGDGRIVNLARLRLSYGTSGSQSFSPYQAMTTFKDYGGLSYQGWYGVYLMAMGNDDLGWQKTKQLNIGVELELLKGRIRINADYYNKTTDDLLSDITLPSASGFGSYKANVGKVVNRGVEIALNAYLIRDTERNISWSIGGTLAHNKNEIKAISNSLKFLNDKMNEEAGGNPSFMYKEGQSMKTIFAVKSLGIDPSNGKEIYVKQDGSLTYDWDPKDKVACGIDEPKIWGNLNTMFRYKGLTFNAIFSYRYGGQMYNYTLVSKVENIYPFDNADKRVLYDRWKTPGEKASFKSVRDFTTTNASSRFVMDENTLECRSLSLGYDIESKWLKKNVALSYLTVTGYMEDVFRISTIKQERGLSYPFARKFSVSLTARF